MIHSEEEMKMNERERETTELRRHHSTNKYSDYGHFRKIKDKNRKLN